MPGEAYIDTIRDKKTKQKNTKQNKSQKNVLGREEMLEWKHRNDEVIYSGLI